MKTLFMISLVALTGCGVEAGSATDQAIATAIEQQSAYENTGGIGHQPNELEEREIVIEYQKVGSQTIRSYADKDIPTCENSMSHQLIYRSSTGQFLRCVDEVWTIANIDAASENGSVVLPSPDKAGGNTEAADKVKSPAELYAERQAALPLGQWADPVKGRTWAILRTMTASEFDRAFHADRANFCPEGFKIPSEFEVRDSLESRNRQIPDGGTILTEIMAELGVPYLMTSSEMGYLVETYNGQRIITGPVIAGRTGAETEANLLPESFGQIAIACLKN